MVYYRRKYAPRRRVYRKKAVAKTAVDKRQNRQIARLSKINKIETKYLQASISASVLNTATLAALTMPTQGSAQGQRDGDIIGWSNWSGHVQYMYGDVTNAVRLIFFQWHPLNSADVPTAAKILAIPGDPLSYFVPDAQSRGKFTVLLDHMVNLSSAGPGSAIRKISIPGSKLAETRFTTGALTGTNIPYIMYLSDSGGAPNPTINALWQYRFFG